MMVPDNNKRLGSIRLFERFINDFNNADETPKQKCMDKFLNMKYMIYYYNDITERINKNSQGELVKFYKESETGFESYKVIHGDEMYYSGKQYPGFVVSGNQRTTFYVSEGMVSGGNTLGGVGLISAATGINLFGDDTATLNINFENGLVNAFALSTIYTLGASAVVVSPLVLYKVGKFIYKKVSTIKQKNTGSLNNTDLLQIIENNTDLFDISYTMLEQSQIGNELSGGGDYNTKKTNYYLNGGDFDIKSPYIYSNSGGGKGNF